MYVVERFGPVVRIRMARAILGRPLLWVHAFWVDGLMIDTGCHHTLPDLIAAVRRERLTVEQVVNTHTHEDHAGGNPWLQERFGVKPRAHRLAMERLASPQTRGEMALYRRLFWGLVGAGTAGEPVGEQVETDRYRFRVYHTPGHARDHIALFAESQGWLFSGDLLISPRLSHVRPEDDSLQLMDSMRRMAALPVQRLFCAHAYRVPDSARPFAEKVAYWEELREKARALAQGGFSPEAVTRILLPHGGAFELLTGGDFARIHLIRGLLREGQRHE